MKIDWMMSWIMLATLGLPGCAATDRAGSASGGASQARAERDAATEPVELHRDGRFIVSAQPTEATLRELADEGVRTVVSFRSAEEMEQLAFDEAEIVSALGMRYVHVPMGRDHGYEPAQVETFARVVRSADGPVYAHCASGGRARNTVMAYLIREQGASVDEAMAASRRLGAREPVLDQLLGEPVRSSLAEPAAEPAAAPND